MLKNQVSIRRSLQHGPRVRLPLCTRAQQTGFRVPPHAVLALIFSLTGKVLPRVNYTYKDNFN